MNLFTEIEQFVEKLFHPVAKTSLAAAATYLTTNKSRLVAAAATYEGTAEDFLVGDINTFMKSDPVLEELIPVVDPLVTAFLDKEVGYGTNDAGTLIDKLAAYLTAAEVTA